MAFDVRLERLARSKAFLLAEIAAWLEESLEKQPTAGSWSAAQIVQHLARTESAILAAMEANIASTARVSIGDRIRSAFLILLFGTSARVRAPGTAEAIMPAGNAAWSSAKDEWEVSQQSLKLFAAAHTSLGPTAGIFRHPVGGWMGLATTLKFLEVHIKHHRYQLERVRATLEVRDQASVGSDR